MKRGKIVKKSGISKYFIKKICFFQIFFVWGNKKPGPRTDPGKEKLC